MATVDHISATSAVSRVLPQPVQKQLPANAAQQIPVTDRLDLSGVSHLLQTLKANDVRLDKVAAIRAQIEAGTYEDEKKLDVAVDKLLDELLG
jgi:anti-sigma28 factor (negative regulator of flagellin synthesis)